MTLTDSDDYNVKADLKHYLAAIKHDTMRKDAAALVKIMEEESGYKAALCGRIVGFGLYHYVYDSGREGDAIVTGFLPGAQHFSLYIMPGFSDFTKELENLGKHKTAKCCLYIRKLADVDEKVLRKIIKRSVITMKKRYECWQQ